MVTVAEPAIFTPMAGGLGDILTNYLDGELGYFPALKRIGATTAVKMWCVNPAAPELFRHYPHVDLVLSEPFALAAGKTDDFRAWAQAGERRFRLMSDPERTCATWERQPFYLSPEEATMAASIEALAPYVVVHPFAGRPERSLSAAGVTRNVIKEAAKHYPVVVLGADSTRNDGRALTALTERFEINHPVLLTFLMGNVVSLVNQFSIRLHAHVASRAARFIGSVSCFNSVAQACGVRSLVFGSTTNRRDMRIGGDVFAKMRTNGTAVHYLDQGPKIAAATVREFLT